MLRSTLSTVACCMAALWTAAGAPALCTAATSLDGRSNAYFASVKDGQDILGARDFYVRQMSPFDRGARMKTARAVADEELLEHYRRNVLAWSDADRGRVEAAIDAIRPNLKALDLPFPPVVFFIQTTGNEEGEAAYTRANAVVLPKHELAKSDASLQKLIAHELFHVLTRANPELQERLFTAIGFVKCNEIELPEKLRSRKITNPDAPRNDHYIRLQYLGEPCLAVPILYADAVAYDPARGGTFFDYLQFQFLLVEAGQEPGHMIARVRGGEPIMADPHWLSGLSAQVGRNTGYIIHPEEILADNFALLAIGTRRVPSPEILDKIKRVLSERPTAKETPPDASVASEPNAPPAAGRESPQAANNAPTPTRVDDAPTAPASEPPPAPMPPPVKATRRSATGTATTPSP